MRRPVPPKRKIKAVAEATARSSSDKAAPEVSGTGSSIKDTEFVSLPSFNLAQLDPRALVLVMTDVVNREAGFTTGDALRQCWENNKVQRVGHFFTAEPSGWHRCVCPDGSSLFVRFNSSKFQLLAESD